MKSIADGIFECHFLCKHFTWQGTVDKRGFKIEYEGIIEEVAKVLQSRHPLTSIEDVKCEFKYYFKRVPQVFDRLVKKENKSAKK